MKNFKKIVYSIVLATIGITMPVSCMNIFLAVINDDIVTINALAQLPEAQRLEAVRGRDNLDNTPLHFAAIFGKPKTIEALIAVGAHLDAQNKNLRTPAQLTVNQEIAQLLNNFQRRIESAPQQALVLSRNQAFTMALALHCRLGASSPVATLSPFLLQDIMRMARQANTQDAEAQARQPRREQTQETPCSGCITC